jgi:hypothetical protein
MVTAQLSSERHHSDRRRRCGVLPNCGACRAVRSKRRRRGCIRSPAPSAATMTVSALP